jgi:hypothetical protein
MRQRVRLRHRHRRPILLHLSHPHLRPLLHNEDRRRTRANPLAMGHATVARFAEMINGCRIVSRPVRLPSGAVVYVCRCAPTGLSANPRAVAP